MNPEWGVALRWALRASRTACYAKEHGLVLQAPPVELNRTPDDEGNEHQVWFQQESKTYLKATWPDFFGLLVVHRPHEEHKVSPIAYLERWHLHNEVFRDQVVFVGAHQSDAGLRLLIRQTTSTSGVDRRHN